jgi:hypothetical protein
MHFRCPVEILSALIASYIFVLVNCPEADPVSGFFANALQPEYNPAE